MPLWMNQMVLLHVGRENFFRLADDGGAHVDGGRMGDAHFAGGEHDGNLGVAHVREVGVLCLVLLFVGGDGPDAEVVDLLVDVVGDRAGAVAAALGLEDADGFALALGGAALAASTVSTYSS